MLCLVLHPLQDDVADFAAAGGDDGDDDEDDDLFTVKAKGGKKDSKGKDKAAGKGKGKASEEPTSEDGGDQEEECE